MNPGPRRVFIAEPPAIYLQRPPLVVDSSLLCALLFDEPEREDAEQRLSGKSLLAPRLLDHEVVNVAVKKQRLGMPAAAVERALADYADQGIEFHDTDPRMQFQNATTGLAAFFGADDWLVSSDPYDFDADNYQFLAGQGEAPPEYKPFSAQLRDQLGPKLDLGRVFTVLDPYVEQVLAPDLSDADKDRRFAADEYPGGFLVYLHDLRQEPKWYQARLYASLRSLLSDMSAYTRALRPKPEFRPSSFKAESTRRALQRRWQALKLQARIFS